MGYQLFIPCMGGTVGVFKFFKEVLNRLRMYGNGYRYSMAIVLGHRSTATSLTGNLAKCVHLSMMVCNMLDHRTTGPYRQIQLLRTPIDKVYIYLLSSTFNAPKCKHCKKCNNQTYVAFHASVFKVIASSWSQYQNKNKKSRKWKIPFWFEPQGWLSMLAANEYRRSNLQKSIFRLLFCDVLSNFRGF